MDRAIVAHTYSLMPTSMFANALVAFVFLLSAVGTFQDWRLWTWIGLQLVALFANVLILVSCRGTIAASPARARLLHRVGVLIAGVAWGAAGLLWPIRAELGPGFVLVFCYAGMCAGGATTLAGDPVAYALFSTTALLPDVVQAFPSLGWISALLLAFVAVTSATVVRNERTLRESLSLRFENAELLAETIREREAAVAARADAERAAEAKTRFLAAASHDLRQPVQALSLFVDVLQRDPKLDLTQRRRAISALGRTTEALRAMIEGLLDISRLDAGIVATAPTRVALEPLLNEVMTALRDESEAKDILLYSGGRTSTVLADSALLARVLHNLAGNAVRHGARGRVLIAVRRHAEHATVQVWDQGRGIAPEDHARIFEEFVQLGNRERDRRKGLGLGLPIVRRICELNAWTLTMRSTPGRGSMFSVTLPLASSEPSAEMDAERIGLGRPLRVLLVEDDALVSEASVAYLEACGCTVHVERTADDAWTTLARLRVAHEAPDVLVTDHRMPGVLTGAALIRCASEARDRGGAVARLPAILLTGDVDESLVGADARGDIAVLRKPVSGDALWEAIQRVITAEGTPPARGVDGPG